MRWPISTLIRTSRPMFLHLGILNAVCKKILKSSGCHIVLRGETLLFSTNPQGFLSR